MTAKKARLLEYIGECGMLTTEQVVRIAGVSPKSAYNHLRDLHDLGLVGRVAVPYASLAPAGEDGSSLAWGPGQNVHVPTKAGLAWLRESGRLSPEAAARRVPDFGPKNALFLAHELLVRDVRVWLELCARAHGGSVELWKDGTAAHVGPALADALFVYRLPGGGKVLPCLVEADRGTERGGRWGRKAEDYAAIRGSQALFEATGGRMAFRLAVVAPEPARRARVAADLAATEVSEIAWVAVRGDLLEGGLDRPVWQRPGEGLSLSPLVTAEGLGT
jgi:hypothetical protein